VRTTKRSGGETPLWCERTQSLLWAIHRLKARYAQLVDARYKPRGAGVVDRPQLEAAARAIAETFTKDGIWDGGAGQTRRGVDEKGESG